MVWTIIAGSFTIGIIGALLIVWMRWTGNLPRFSSSIEIQEAEIEYKNLCKVIGKKMNNGRDLSGPEVTYSDNLKKYIDHQRVRSFGVASIIYLILGGATAVLFVGIGSTDIQNPFIIVKLVLAGALWSSFYSFVDVTKAETTLTTIREKKDDSAAEALVVSKRNFESEINDIIEKSKKELKTLGDKYNKLADKYNTLAEEYEKAKIGEG